MVINMQLTSFYKKALCCAIAAASLFLASHAQAASKRTTSSIVIDALSGEVISSSNADEKRYPASLTKLMTLYITFSALEKGDITFDDKLKVSRHAANREPSRIGVKPGETISVKEAVLALIVKSANDCASVLAENLGGSEEEFAELMTQTAKDLGMKTTTFKNASGLPNREQKTTARDMAILASAIYHHFPEYYDLFSTPKFKYKELTFYNHNHLLKHFKGADGMKTGYTSAAGYNIVTSAERNGRRVIAVTMGHNSIKDRDLKVAELMNYGFKKLENNQQPPHRMYAKLELPEFDDFENSDDKVWGIQIGAFSNYIKARNYALDIQGKIHLPYAQKTEINVEPATKGAAVVYRSQLIGLAKNEAEKTCYSLNNSNKSCIVVSIQPENNQHLAMSEHE